MTRNVFFWLIVCCFLGAGCDPDPRVRRNPLDPLNPQTEGRPQNLRAIAGHQHVVLSWDPIFVADLTGYRLQRTQTAGNQTVIRDIDVAEQYNRFVDLDVANGTTYRYTLTAQTDSGVESPSSEVAEVTPGPSSCWVADPGFDLLYRTSADGRQIAVQVIGLLDPLSVSTDPNDGGCWTADPTSGVLVRISADGEIDAVISNLLRPLMAAVDARDGACWVIEDGNAAGQTSAVTRVGRDGAIQFHVFTFIDPRAIAVDQTDGSVWVVDRGNRQVSKLNENGNIRITIGGFAAPVWVVANPTDGGCWVVDQSPPRVVRLDRTGTQTGIVSGFIEPVTGSYDESNGNLWIADPGQQAIVKLLDGLPNAYDIRQQQGFHLTISGIQNPVSISADPETGDFWVAETGNRFVLKLTASGQALGGIQLPGSSHPTSVSVDSGTRHRIAAP